MNYGFIGTGSMGSAIINGLISSGVKPDTIYCTTAHSDTLATFTKETNTIPCASNEELVKKAGKDGIIVLACKPQHIAGILPSICELLLQNNCLLISVAAGTTLSTLASLLQPGQKIIRTMPNLAAAIKKSTTALCPNKYATEEDIKHAITLFQSIGYTHIIEEKLFSAFSAVAGCSPAFTCEYIDNMAKAGVNFGLTKKQATLIATQAVFGTANLLLEEYDNGITPASLADNVQSPGGTTVAGVVALEQTGFGSSVISAVQASVKRDKELGQSKN